MENVGIDDDQVIGVYGKDLALDQKLPFSANDEEKLCVGVGVGNRMPVVSVAVAGYIHKLCCALGGKGTAGTLAIIILAHQIHILNFIYIDIIPLLSPSFNGYFSGDFPVNVKGYMIFCTTTVKMYKLKVYIFDKMLKIRRKQYK